MANEALQGGFVFYNDGGDFSVIDYILLADKGDITIKDTGVDYGVASAAEGKVCSDVCTDFNVGLKVLVCIYGFPTSAFTQKECFFVFVGIQFVLMCQSLLLNLLA